MTVIENQLIELAQKHGITNKLELAHLLAQCNHESANFTRMVENLNYSVTGLLTVFPKYFSATTANMYGRTSNQPANQTLIANIAYGGRMGNRAGTNDGSDFRGRGVIQLTGRDNYTIFNQWLKANGYNFDVIARPDEVGTNKELQLLSAIWFWQARKLSVPAQRDDVALVTKLINGGSNGLIERVTLTNCYKEVLN